MPHERRGLHRMGGLLWAAVASCSVAVAALAQEPAPGFEVVSVRRAPVPEQAWNRPSQPSWAAVLPGGRFEARARTIGDLVRIAYAFDHADPSRGIVEVPTGWPLLERFDITATAGQEWTTLRPGMVPPELREMLRALLEDRFALKTRARTRRVDAVGLRLSSATGALGPRIRPAAGECLGPFAPAQSDEPESERCPLVRDQTQLHVEGATMEEIAHLLARFGLNAAPGLVAVNQTGLDGRYDAALSLASSTVDPLRNDRVAIGYERRPAALHEAMVAQLGLRFERVKVEIPVLTIERVRRPKED